MKIAVCTDGAGQVFQHFGRTPEFTVFEATDGKITGFKTVPTGECGHGALAEFLAVRGIGKIICGGIGGGALIALAAANIECIPGASGGAQAAAEAYLRGELRQNPDYMCPDHEHHGGEGHSCGGNCGGCHHHE